MITGMASKIKFIIGLATFCNNSAVFAKFSEAFSLLLSLLSADILTGRTCRLLSALLSGERELNIYRLNNIDYCTAAARAVLQFYHLKLCLLVLLLL